MVRLAQILQDYLKTNLKVHALLKAESVTTLSPYNKENIIVP